MADASHVILDPALQNFVARASVAGWDEATLAYRRAIVEAEPGSAPHNEYDVPAWRIGERTKTVAVGIVRGSALRCRTCQLAMERCSVGSPMAANCSDGSPLAPRDR